MANWKQALTEATTYGLTGAAGGAPFGGVGAGVGGAAGATAGFFHGLFQPTKKDLKKKEMKKKAKLMNNPSGQLPTQQSGNIITGYNPYISSASQLNPAQQNAQNELLPGITQNLKNPINFKDLENETVRNYERNVLPKLTHRFTAETGGKLSSPEFGRTQREGGENLQLQLNAQRAKHELDQQQQQGNLLGTLLRPSQENFFNEPTEGLVGTTLPHVTNAILGEALPSLINLFKSNPSKVAQQIQGLDSATKKQLMDYVTTGAGSSAPSALKEVISANAKTGLSSYLPTSTLGKAGLGVAAAGITAYGLNKLFNHLLSE